MQRLRRTLESDPELAEQFEQDENADLDEILMSLPGRKIEGAYLPRDSQDHWTYGLVAAVAFFAAVLLLFGPGKADFMHGLWVALFTATAGVGMLIGLQFVAFLTQGFWLIGRGPLVIIFYIIKFIGFSYRAALDPEYGFLLSFLGFTCGVAFCEELTKVLPVLYYMRSGGKLDWRGARYWGLASGVGFGVAEGLMYCSQFYNGLATADTYLVRFTSCVALHAVWTGASSLVVWGLRRPLASEWDWGYLASIVLRVLMIPTVLHGLYNTFLKIELPGLALLVAVASFAWLIGLTEMMRASDPTARAKPSWSSSSF